MLEVEGSITKAKKKVNSEAFLVVYDMSSAQSLEMVSDFCMIRY